MFGSRARSVVFASLAGLLVVGLGLTPSAASAAGRALGRDRDKEQLDRQERGPTKVEAPTSRTREGTTAQPNRSPTPELRTITGPSAFSPRTAPQRNDSPARLWSSPRTPRESNTSAPQRVSVQPLPERRSPIWDRPTPNQVAPPERKAAPESSGRVVRAPVTFRPAPPADTGRQVSAPSSNNVPAPNPYLRTGRPDWVREQPAPVARTRDPEQAREQERDRSRDRVQYRVTPDANRGGQVNVPRADFRGPQAERDVKLVAPEERPQVQRQLRDRLRERNQARVGPALERPTRDVVGNPVTADVSIIYRDRVNRISIGYEHVRRDFGAPAHHYAFFPRAPGDYWDGYWDGYADGYWADRHHHHHPVVVLSFYYGYYWSDPYWFAFSYPGYYPAIYHYWGWSPGWIYPTRVYYVPVEYVYVPATPYRYYYGGYGVDYSGAGRAVEDLRRAWFNSEIAPLAEHLTDRLDIRVYFDGEYSYTTSTEDYYAMTVDTMATIQTVALDFDQPVWISTHEVFYTGRHIFYDPDGVRHTIYVSYRLRRLGGDWYIVGVGSSLNPIRHQYTDFRYS